MPRVRDSASDPLDFCRDCFPSEADAEEEFGLEATGTPGPDGRGDCFAHNDDHPPYEDENYTCFKCHKPLEEEDNEP